MSLTVSFQGSLGAYSHMACMAVYPECDVIPCMTFSAAMQAVENGQADLAMIPIENSSAGRVTDAQRLLLETELHVIGEHFEPVRHCLLARPHVKLSDIKAVYSHVQALGQCANNIEKHGFKPQAFSDTAGAAEWLAKEGAGKPYAAIASKLSGEIYGLNILDDNFQDYDHNTTRFLIFSKTASTPKIDEKSILSIVFEVQHKPKALFEALRCIADKDLNMLKLESYIDPSFKSAVFYVELMGHPDDLITQQALAELKYEAKKVVLRGCYKASAFRQK